MIIACYVTDLYCDCEKCSKHGRATKRQYTGRSLSQTLREAKADGWRIGSDKQTVCAPGHFKALERKE